jgi:hypothetical protein
MRALKASILFLNGSNFDFLILPLGVGCRGHYPTHCIRVLKAIPSCILFVVGICGIRPFVTEAFCGFT